MLRLWFLYIPVLEFEYALNLGDMLKTQGALFFIMPINFTS